MGDLRIIIAGSDELARQLIAMRFERRGAQVIQRADGEGAARELLRNAHRATVVLVGELEDGTPGAFATWLGEDAATADVPLVVIAPRGRPELAADARAAGADATFTLPMDLDEIVERVVELVHAPAFAPALVAA